MGFIDYHGTKENLFEEVVEYAKIQDELERQRRDEQSKSEWISAFLDDPRYAKADTNTLLKLSVKAYRDAAGLYRGLELPDDIHNSGIDSLQMWQDLWLECSSYCTEVMGLQPAKQEPLLETLFDRLLNLEGRTSAGRHLKESRDNYRYRKYLQKSFSFEDSKAPAFWRWLADVCRGDCTTIRQMLQSYQQYFTCLTYYLYKNIHPHSDQWMWKFEKVQKNIQDLDEQLKLNKLEKPGIRQCMNPLYLERTVEGFDIICLRMVSFSGKMQVWDGDPEMIEDLYEFLKENTAESGKISSILPENIVFQIKKGILPSFEEASVSGLQPGETVHFLDHMILYQPEENGDRFTSQKGTFIITDRKLMIQCSGGAEIPISRIDRVVQYDMLPSVLEIRTNGRSYPVLLPDSGTAYCVLCLFANRKDAAKKPEVPVPFSYEELVEKADIEACIFAFESLETYPLPSGLKQDLQSLLLKLRGLKKTLDKYPERRDEIHRFLEYYLPETFRIIVSFYEYQDTGVNQSVLEKILDQVRESIRILDGAAEKKILDIYQIETMNTVAQAEALRTILGQDGYSADRQILVH